jgi:hypothetical protein
VSAADAGGVALRLHVEHLRIEGLVPMQAEELAALVGVHLERLVETYGVPPLWTGGGALRFDAAPVRVQAGWSREQLAAAVARQLYEQAYGPLGPWAGSTSAAGGETTVQTNEETRR